VKENQAFNGAVTERTCAGSLRLLVEDHAQGPVCTRRKSRGTYRDIHNLRTLRHIVVALMSAYAEEILVDKLNKLVNTQESIQSIQKKLSLMMLCGDCVL
jgi:hypothetical protein